jgi:hypothetical protein
VLKFEGFRTWWYSCTAPAVFCTKQERRLKGAK